LKVELLLIFLRNNYLNPFYFLKSGDIMGDETGDDVGDDFSKTTDGDNLSLLVGKIPFNLVDVVNIVKESGYSSNISFGTGKMGKIRKEEFFARLLETNPDVAYAFAMKTKYPGFKTLARAVLALERPYTWSGKSDPELMNSRGYSFIDRHDARSFEIAKELQNPFLFRSAFEEMGREFSSGYLFKVATAVGCEDIRIRAAARLALHDPATCYQTGLRENDVLLTNLAIESMRDNLEAQVEAAVNIKDTTWLRNLFPEVVQKTPELARIIANTLDDNKLRRESAESFLRNAQEPEDYMTALSLSDYLKDPVLFQRTLGYAVAKFDPSFEQHKESFKLILGTAKHIALNYKQAGNLDFLVRLYQFECKSDAKELVTALYSK
jgi:hypothetical protein